MKKLKWIGFALMLMATGCSTSKISTSWKAEKTIAKKYNKIMVLGLIREVDRTVQMNMEIHLVGDLQDLGYHAVSSLQEFGPKAFDKMDEETAIATLKNSGVDVVITVVMLDKEKEKNYIPGNLQKLTDSTNSNRFWVYRSVLYNRICSSGYYVTNTKYFWESNFYDVSTQKLVYSMQTGSFDAVNSPMLGHQFGQVIAKDIVKNQVLIPAGNLTSKLY